ncbi:MAG TPA: ribosome biogenesis GTPase YlqF [Ruminococcaceae bacterium]|nr:ribosome biogenesis GTPase YlqF [Oscillospiraceae bacterium]
MGNMSNIQWFPGHMAKTKRKITESLKLVDAVAEIVDARIPFSSRNPELDGLVGDKPRILILSKPDLADPGISAKWTAYFKQAGWVAFEADCSSGRGLGQFLPGVKRLLEKKLRAYEAKGMTGKKLRVMVAGIPNVGKSSFINCMSKGAKAKVEDRPGVTRGNQWFTIDKNVELLDTPGVLWPKFDDPEVGERLAFTGAIKDAVLDIESLALRLIEFLMKEYPENLKERYKLTAVTDESALGIAGEIGKKRGMLISGGEVDYERLSVMLLDEFRGGKIGRISLEKPKRED